MTRGWPRWRRSTSSKPLLDDELALHARCAVSVDRAVEGVLPWLKIERDTGARAGDLVGSLAVDAGSLQLDVVEERGVVREVNRHVSGSGLERGLVELERAAWIRRQLQSFAAPAASGGRSCAATRRGRLISAATGSEAQGEEASVRIRLGIFTETVPRFTSCSVQKSWSALASP